VERHVDLSEDATNEGSRKREKPFAKPEDVLKDAEWTIVSF
jgi:hypothetical protein